ncbi:unnamed protein product [Urochloa humidicola]
MPRSKERSSTSDSSSPKSPRLLPESKPHSAAAGLAARATTSSPHLQAAGDLERPPPPSPNPNTVPTPRAPRSKQGGFHGLCRPSRARVHAPAPFSSAFSSSSPHMSSGGGGGPLNSEQRQQLLAFLNEYTVRSGKTVYYKVHAALTRDTGSFEIHFEHILKYNKELAYAICNSQDRFNEWVYPTVYQFLISEGIVKNVIEKMKITFCAMPMSVKPVEDFLQECGPLISIKSIFGGSFKLCAAHDIGMVLVHGFLQEIYSNHIKNLTWNGVFSMSDMVVVNSTECRITKKSARGGSHCTAKDLQRIGEIFMPWFRCNEGMALYFDVLQEDLSMVGEDEVKEEGFWEYLLSHLALKQSMARYYLECGLQHAAISLGGPGMPIESVLAVHSDWKALIPINLTENTPITDFSLYKVFWSKCDPTEGVDDPFAATVGGLLAYKSSFLQFGDEYVKVHDRTELEQFAANTFPQALPNILRRLLRDCKMHMNGPLMMHWEAYRTSRIGNDRNTEA